MKLLVVDDAKINRYVLVKYLEMYERDRKLEFDIEEAKNGLQAVQNCRDTYYKVIFMDLVMPFLDGQAASKQICHYYRSVGQRKNIVATTGIIDKSIMSSCIEHYILKPVDKNKLFDILDSILESD